MRLGAQGMRLEDLRRRGKIPVRGVLCAAGAEQARPARLQSRAGSALERERLRGSELHRRGFQYSPGDSPEKAVRAPIVQDQKTNQWASENYTVMFSVSVIAQLCYNNA